MHIVMPGLVPGIHVFLCRRSLKTWMAGTRPAMPTKWFEMQDDRNESAKPQWPLEARSRVPYESRWAPCVRTHGSGQGQLP
jgi:hypothetical protein